MKPVVVSLVVIGVVHHYEAWIVIGLDRRRIVVTGGGTALHIGGSAGNRTGQQTKGKADLQKMDCPH